MSDTNRKKEQYLEDIEVPDINIKEMLNTSHPDHYKDTGSHYRYDYKGIKMDPYRVFEIYNVTDAKAQHAIKKLLRMEGKGHSQEQVWREVYDVVIRALEMIEEDKQHNYK